MIARVLGVITWAMVSAVMLPLSGSTSASTGVQPRTTAELALAMNVRGLVITSAPAGMSRACNASSRAAVPFMRATAWRQSAASPYSRSNALPSSPVQ